MDVTFSPGYEFSWYLFLRHLALIQCLIVGFASVFADFAKEDFDFVFSWSVSYIAFQQKGVYLHRTKVKPKCYLYSLVGVSSRHKQKTWRLCSCFGACFKEVRGFRDCTNVLVSLDDVDLIEWYRFSRHVIVDIMNSFHCWEEKLWNSNLYTVTRAFHPLMKIY